MIVACERCGAFVQRAAGEVNRARRAGLRLFCGRVCAGLARRVAKSAEQKRAEKAAYDAAYREKNADLLAAKKRAYHRETYDPDKARSLRELNKPRMRQVQRAWYEKHREEKRRYDEALRGMAYGDYAESWRLLLDLEREIRRLVPDKYERLKARGYYDRNRKGELRA